MVANRYNEDFQFLTLINRPLLLRESTYAKVSDKKGWDKKYYILKKFFLEIILFCIIRLVELKYVSKWVLFVIDKDINETHKTNNN
jgi:hypothetical protein